jgi:hypothetical protein
LYFRNVKCISEGANCISEKLNEFQKGEFISENIICISENNNKIKTYAKTDLRLLQVRNIGV